MRCNPEFYCVGKIPPIGIGLQRRMVLKWFYGPPLQGRVVLQWFYGPPLQGRVVLQWFYSPRAVGTTLPEVRALYRVPFSS